MCHIACECRSSIPLKAWNMHVAPRGMQHSRTPTLCCSLVLLCAAHTGACRLPEGSLPIFAWVGLVTMHCSSSRFIAGACKPSGKSRAEGGRSRHYLGGLMSRRCGECVLCEETTLGLDEPERLTEVGTGDIVVLFSKEGLRCCPCIPR
jgi:hypothetical protein